MILLVIVPATFPSYVISVSVREKTDKMLLSQSLLNPSQEKEQARMSELYLTSVLVTENWNHMKPQEYVSD